MARDEQLHVALLHLRTARPHDWRFQRELDELNEAAVATVHSMGWTAELVPAAEASEREVLHAARKADLVVILGGEDVEPSLYGADSAYPGGGQHEVRADRSQIAVVLEAAGSGRPLLGICRGQQLMNVAFGGTLVQHVDGHRGSAEGYTRTRITTVEEGYEPIVPASGEVMCTHHQIVGELGRGLRVVARSADGFPEAIVHEHAPMLGVQWHPEHPAVAATHLTPLLRWLAAKRPSNAA